MTTTTIFLALAAITAALIAWQVTRRPRFWCVLRGGHCEKHGACATSTDCWVGRR